jgi:hypothetical protein
MLDVDPPDEKGESRSRLLAVEIKRKGAEVAVPAPGRQGFQGLRRRGEAAHFGRGDDFFVTDAAQKPIDSLDKGRLNLDPLKFSILPPRRLEGDVRRRLEDAPRLFLRQEHARRGLEGRPLPGTCRSSTA